MTWTTNRYCPACDEWVDRDPCEQCGGESNRQLMDDERERDEDDGRTYGDPRDERDKRRHA